MYFVIQTISRSEKEMMDKILKYVNKEYIQDIFIPTRIRQKKVNSKWIDYEERWFPGYIFVETSTPKDLARELKGIEGFTKLVGFGDRANISYMPLSEQEEKIIDKLLGRNVDKNNSTVELSRIEIEEGKKVRVIDGPLFGVEGTLIKYNLHKRIATIEMEFCGKIMKVNVGIDIITESE